MNSTGPLLLEGARLELPRCEVVRRWPHQHHGQLRRPSGCDGHGDEVAIIWEGTGRDAGPEVVGLTYADLQRETERFGNVPKSLGVTKGDIVTIYMGMVPEVAIAMLACAGSVWPLGDLRRLQCLGDRRPGQ